MYVRPLNANIAHGASAGLRSGCGRVGLTGRLLSCDRPASVRQPRGGSPRTIHAIVWRQRL